MFTRLAEQRFNWVSAQPFASFSYPASRQQLIRSQALRADIQTPGDLMNRLVAAQSHAQHKPKNLTPRQAAPPYGGLRREVQRTRYPLYWDVLSEGAQVRKVEEIAKVEQLLLNGH